MPGEGFQMDAIQRIRKNRELLARSKAFDVKENNNFINAPQWHVKVKPDFYNSLSAIKISRLRKAIKLKRFITVVVSTVIAALIVLFLYLSNR
ncbi:MAG: hypothetical protein WBA74_02490 [Cyclobacteriaceae bacterium]